MASVFFGQAAATPTDTVLATLAIGTADKVRGIINSTIAGNLVVEESIDGGQNWYDVSSVFPVAIVANTPLPFEVEPYGPLVRFTFDNGGAIATVSFAARIVSAGPR